MPLSGNVFDEADLEKFLIDKENLWAAYGYGPWAFVVDGHFVGWGGLQYEQGRCRPCYGITS